MLRANLRNHCKAHDETPLSTIPRDVKTRWNSTINMLGKALEVKLALNGLCEQHKKDKTLTALTDDEWGLLEALYQTSNVRLFRFLDLFLILTVL